MARPQGPVSKSQPAVFLARALATKIEYQFPETAEGRLMFAVINRALYDLTSLDRTTDYERTRREAKRFLRGELWPASICGVDPDWIRYQLRVAGIDIEEVYP